MENFEITKEQILEIEDCGNYIVTERLKSMFPEAFKTKFTGWAKDICEFNKDWIAYYENDILKYGINASGEWFEAKSISNYNECESNRLATEQEVKTALINEAKKRGFGSIGVKFIDVFGDLQTSEINGFDFWNLNNSNVLLENKFNISVSSCGGVIFNKGKWATIIETITKEEAEKLLNKKII